MSLLKNVKSFGLFGRVMSSLIVPSTQRNYFHVDKSAVADDKKKRVAASLRSFEMRRTAELIRCWLILRLSAINSFVDHSEKLLKAARKLVGKRVFDSVLRTTFYGQFVGGESVKELTKTVQRLSKAGVRSMLCIPIETTEANEDDFLLGEEAFRKNTDIVSGCINMTDQLEKGGFSQIKLTSLCGPGLLLSMSEQLVSHECCHQEPFEWSIRRVGELLKAERYEDVVISSFTDLKNAQFQAALRRFDQLAKLCKDKGIVFMLDAEQTYIQPALGYFVLVLQHKYNSDIPVVYNTYQCYRKDTLKRIQADYEYGKENGFKIAGKLVRGAYMVEEQRIASENGTEDPINEGFHKTTEMYHSVVDFILPLVKARNAGVMIAGHNEDTILYVLNRMKEMEFDRRNDLLCFAQLYGMCDHVTEGLAKLGCEVYKSVPYGTVESTLLYLTRRAQENKSVMQRTVIERGLIMGELIKRTKIGFHNEKAQHET